MLSEKVGWAGHHEWLLRVSFQRWQPGVMVYFDFGIIELSQVCPKAVPLRRTRDSGASARA